jgi:hypothetical protein
MIEIVLGAIVIAIWIAFVLWGVGAIALSAMRKPAKDAAQSCVAGLFAGGALAAGVILFMKNQLPFDVAGLGFVLAAGGGLWIWVLGRAFLKPDAKLNPEALQHILDKMIRRDLVTVLVPIVEPSFTLMCPVRYVKVQATATQDEIMTELLTGRPIEPGIQLTLDRSFRLRNDDEVQKFKNASREQKK